MAPSPNAVFDRATVSQARLLDRYRRNRRRSAVLFDLVADEAFYGRPIALRHPIVFYFGHLPAFSFNVLVKNTLGRPGIDPELERLFARGIDPDESTHASTESIRGRSSWPSRDRVIAFAHEADGRVVEALEQVDLVGSGEGSRHAEAVLTILEHEEMHQETLLYMWHRLSFAEKRKPAGYHARTDGPEPDLERLHVPGGLVTLGVDRDTIPFGWDNECPACSAHVPGFSIDRHDVTNGRFLEFVEAGGYRDPRWWTPDDWAWVVSEGMSHPLFWERDPSGWNWRGMFESIPLPRSWPVYVSHAEAAAFARWRGARLPTEAEFQRAAYGAVEGERRYPWGSDDPSSDRGVFDFASWDPEPAGSHPAGASAWGVEDLVGNGWEWTGTPFAPFPGFRPMATYPEYSADFFDGRHFVMKGASPATARELIRPTFRNWFRARYPYVYATFRCVTSD
jgi:ergothioneine biosynthesis protein EgtB